MSRTFQSLRHRNFRLFFIGQSISNSGNWLTSIALTLLVLRVTGSGVAVGWLAACQYGPIMLLSPWGGAIADRSDKHRLLFVTQGLEMAQSIGLAVLAFQPHPSLFALYALAAAGGVVLALDNPLRRSFVTEMVSPEDRQNAVVLYSMIVNLSRVFGPALAGVLVTTLGYGWCFTVDAVTYVAVIACLAMMRPEELRRVPPRPRQAGEVRAGLRYLRSVPALFITYAMLAAIGLFAYNFPVTLPLFVTHGLHGSDAEFTILYSILSVGSLVSALWVARRARITVRHAVVGASVLGVALLVLSASPTVPIAVGVAFFVGVASILYTTSTTALVQVRARPDMHGRLLAIQTIFLVGSSALGGPISGWVADTFGARALIAMGGVVCLLAAGAGSVAERRNPDVERLEE
jgi:MFS family permease